MAYLACFRFLLKWVVISVLIVYGINYWLRHKSYVFNEKDVAAIARRHQVSENSESHLKAAFGNIAEELRTKYKGHILPDKDFQWIFINAGGWMGSMCVLHASLTEYVLFFGTAVDTTGHSGRYWANISDTILSGTFYQWREGDITRLTFKKGDTVYHSLGEVTALSWVSGTWMVEYGRGFVPSTLIFALADSFFSTTDFVTVFYIIRVYIKALLLEAGFYLGNVSNFIENQF